MYYVNLLSYLYARYFEFKGEIITTFADELLTAKKAVDFLFKRLLITTAKQKILTKTLKNKCDIIAKLSYYDTQKRLTNYVANAITEGQSLRTFMIKTSKDNVYSKVSSISANYMEVIYRNNVGSAYAGGKYEQQQGNSKVEMLKYNAVDDDLTSEICSQMNGVVRPKNDPIWDSYYVMNHDNCRCQITTITKTQVKKKNIKSTPNFKLTNEAKKQGKRFKGNPSKWTNASPSMSKRLKEERKQKVFDFKNK